MTTVPFPEIFVGRIHEVHEIAAFITSNQSVSLIGPSRIGKTALVRHLMQPPVASGPALAATALFVYLDCQALRTGTHTEIFGAFVHAVDTAARQHGLLPELPAATATQPSRLSFETAVRHFNRHGLRVVLILDDFEQLSSNSQLDLPFFNALRSAAARHDLVFLTASTRPLIELTYLGRAQEVLSSPFFNIFAPLFLGLLPEDDARQLIHEFGRVAGVTFAPAIVDFIYGLAGGHPFVLRVACSEAFHAPDNQEAIERRTMQRLATHFADSWHALTGFEQQFVRRLDEAAAQAAADAHARCALRDLLQKCVLVHDGSSYCYASRAWEEFVAAQAE